MAKRKDNNRQIAATKEWITNALLDLMNKKQFQKISIKEIAEYADIDRRTFYRHYQSKEHILDEYILSIVQPHFNRLMKMSINSEKELAEKHFELLFDNLNFLRQLKRHNLFSHLLLRYESYISLFREIRGLPQNSNADNKFRLAFKTGGFLSVVSAWIEEEPVKTPSEMAQIISDFLNNGFNSLCSEESLAPPNC